MRKLLAVLLAAIMLVGALAVLPVGAENAPVISEFDGTASDVNMDLVITEILVDSSSGHGDLDNQVAENGDVAVYSSADAFDYIEIYNRGTSKVNLYDYCIVKGPAANFNNTIISEKAGVFSWRAKMAEGDIFNPSLGVAPSMKTAVDNCSNPEEAVLEPGQFAVIWFYDADTTKLAEKEGNVNIAKFKQHYGMADNALVVAVCGKQGAEGGTFALEAGYTYALVESDFAVIQQTILNPNSENAVLTSNGEKILCMADYIVGNAVGIASTAGMDDAAAYYVPASCSPDLLNAITKKGYEADGKENEFVPIKDYVEAKYTVSYRSTAIVTYVEAPSPGSMPAWQWAYVDPIGESGVASGVPYTHGLQALEEKIRENEAPYDAAMKALVTDWSENDAIKKDGKLDTTDDNGKSAWLTKGVADFLDKKSNIIGDETSRSETKIDYSKNFVSRAELEKRHGLNKKQNTNKKEGLPIWVLILIIVGGVVLVAGIAVVVIIIVKKKNRPVAADDVAAEGEIEIVDETAANEAPVEEEKKE